MRGDRAHGAVRGRTGGPLSTLGSIVGAAIVLVALGAGPAAAQEDTASADRDRIVLTGELLIAAEDTVDAAVILDGPARVDGTVQETLVVLNGDAEISGTVQQDVVVLNGEVVVRSGAEIGGDLVTQSTPEVEDGATIRGERSNVIARFDFDIADGFGGRIWWWLAYSASVLMPGPAAPRVRPGAVPGRPRGRDERDRLVDRVGFRPLLPPADRIGAPPHHPGGHPARHLHRCSRWRSCTRSATSSRSSGSGAGCSGPHSPGSWRSLAAGSSSVSSR